MPPLPADRMTDAQRKAAAEMIAGPRKGVKGPFIPLLRSPELMDRLQKVGEYLRFQSSLPQRISELIMLVVSREWTQHFEWFVHVPLGRKAGISEDTIAALAEGRRPSGMSEDEELAYDFCVELLRNKGVSETTYRRAVAKFGENGVIDMIGVAGYFTTVSMVMNVAHSPPSDDKSVGAMSPYPL
jgi:4-carboxymuconolactone decarboxylase